MRRGVFIGLLLVIVAIGAIAQPVAGDDEYPGDCDEAPLIETPTTVSGTIDITSDTDTVRVEVQRGDYISVRAMAGEGAQTFVVSHPPDPDINFRNESGSVEHIDLNTVDYEREIEPDVEGTYEIWPQEDGTLCFQIEDKGDPESLPYDWRLSLAETDPQPPEFEPASDELQEQVESLDAQIEEQNQSIADLRSELSSRESRMGELESRLEERNETIADLRSTLEEANSEGNSNVTLNVEVTPAEDRPNFVTGGEAQVTVQNENIDPSNIAIEFGDATYDPGDDGQAEVALADAGTQELTVVYGDVRETVTLNIQESSGADDSQPQSTQGSGNSNDQTAENGPGFGIVTAAGAAVLLVVVCLWRRRTN